MAEAIGPGTPLICVDDTGINYSELSLTRGALYFCEEVRELSEICPRDNCGNIGISLKDKPRWACAIHGSHPTWYCPNHFAPLNSGEHQLTKEEIDLPVLANEPA